MPVDRPNRDRAANALAAYLRGEINNFKLQEETLDLETRDKSLISLSIMLWRCYDDIRPHTVHASPEGWQFLIRCVAWLRTNLESPTSYRSRPSSSPFPSDDLWLANRHLVAADGFPPYDPAIHDQPLPPLVQPWIVAAIVLVGLVLLFYAGTHTPPCR